MTLVRWSPLHELENMQRHLSCLLDDVNLSPAPDSEKWMPAVDIRETGDALLVQAELPGIRKEDVHLEIKDDVLTISGERTYKKDVEAENTHRVERAYGRFVRSFSLPGNIDATQIEALMQDGVLEVRLHKKEDAKPRQISIN